MIEIALRKQDKGRVCAKGWCEKRGRVASQAACPTHANESTLAWIPQLPKRELRGLAAVSSSHVDLLDDNSSYGLSKAPCRAVGTVREGGALLAPATRWPRPRRPILLPRRPQHAAFRASRSPSSLPQP